MKRYVIYRLTGLIPILLFVSLIVFGLMNLLPGDPVTAMFGPDSGVSEEVLEARREELNLDRSVPERYGIWLTDMVSGDLGESIRTREPVKRAIARAIPPTLWLAASSFAVALIVALPVGILAAGRTNRWINAIANGLTLGGLSIPSFVIGIIFILLLAIQLQLFPAVGYTPIHEDPFEFLRKLALPALTQGLHLAAILAITIRHHVADELSSDYVRTAHSKGLPKRVVLVRHVFRNAIVGITGVAGWLFISQIGGTIVVETLFAWPGLGRLAFTAVQGRDYPIIQSIVLLAAVLFLLVNLGLDLMAKRLDPRLQLGKRIQANR